MISTTLCPGLLSWYFLTCCLFPLVYFSFILFYSSDWYILIFSLLKFFLCSSLPLLSLVNIFMTWPLYQVDSLPAFICFPACVSCPLFGTCFSVSLICPILYVCLCILGISAVSPGLERVAWCRRCPVRPRITIPLAARARCSRDVTYVGSVCPPVVVEPWPLQVGRAGPWPSWLWGWAVTAVSMLVFAQCFQPNERKFMLMADIYAC